MITTTIPQDHLYTAESLAALDRQIEDARVRLQDALGAMGENMDGGNTWHDNAFFEEATTRVDQWTNQLGWLLQLRALAKVVDNLQSCGAVGVGSQVRIRVDFGSGVVEDQLIVISGHFTIGRSDDESAIKVSSSAPLGVALLSKQAGDEFTYVTPSGKTVAGLVLDVM